MSPRSGGFLLILHARSLGSQRLSWKQGYPLVLAGQVPCASASSRRGSLNIRDLIHPDDFDMLRVGIEP